MPKSNIVASIITDPQENSPLVATATTAKLMSITAIAAAKPSPHFCFRKTPIKAIVYIAPKMRNIITEDASADVAE